MVGFCKILTFSKLIFPMILIANPGPGKGCLCKIFFVNPIDFLNSSLHL